MKACDYIVWKCVISGMDIVKQDNRFRVSGGHDISFCHDFFLHDKLLIDYISDPIHIDEIERIVFYLIYAEGRWQLHNLQT